MLDEFDWKYVGTNKEKKIEDITNFLSLQNREGEVIGEFPHGIILNTEKQSPRYNPLNKFILDNCDAAYVMEDNNPALLEILDVIKS